MLRFSVLSACLLMVGCHATPGQAVRPKPITAKQALKEVQCDAVSDYARPLVVDLPPEERMLLETNMRQGVAFVRYDCERLEVLPDCTVAGDYGYVGVTSKEEVVALRDRNELAVNLPVSGSLLAAKLESELAAGASLDLAMLMVGMRRTTKSNVPGGLASSCKGATHFVRGVFVGAFAMSTSERGKAQAAAQIFGAGAAAVSESLRRAQRRDGDPEACRRATLRDKAPPDQCGAVLRLELRAVGGEGDPEASSEVKITEATCPKGYVLAKSGACVEPAKQQADASFLCVYGDALVCKAQCARGHGGSCNNLGVMTVHGEGVPKNPKQAEALFEAACQAGEPDGCLNRARMYNDRLSEYEKGQAVAADLNRRACEAGGMEGCLELAFAHRYGDGLKKDAARGDELIDRACRGGYLTACSLQSKSPRERRALLVEACERGELMGCSRAGSELLEYEKDGKAAEPLLLKACEGGYYSACITLGSAYLEAYKGTPRNPEQALRLFRRACDGGNELACARRAEAEVGVKGSKCRKGDAKMCQELGELCGMQDPVSSPVACDFLKIACEEGHNALACKLSDETFQG